MSRVLTYGTFDVFHYGHMRLLERARALGSYLIVGVSTDEFNEIKGKRATLTYEERARMVSMLRVVDEVIPETTWEQKEADIENHAIDVFVMGDDWTGHFDHLKELCQVVYLSRTPNVSSTGIRTLDD